MKIGEFSRATCTAIESIRFYEREGLLPAPVRSRNNYRCYEQEHVARLLLIRSCRVLGMSLSEIRSLFGWGNGESNECSVIDQAILEYLSKVENRLAQLAQLKTHLLELRRLSSP